MARRYVRDKGGRFASKGGGSRGKGGKMGKSAKNTKARAAYKSQSGKLREAKKMANIKGNNTKSEKTYWNRQLGGAKSGMTRVTNRLTKKRAAAAPTKKAAPKRRGATLKQVATHKRMSKGALKTPKGKMSKAKLNSAKYEYKGASRADRMQGITATKARKRVIKKQTGKTAYEQKMGTEVAPTRLGRTKAPRAGSKTKSQKIRAKINKKKSVNKELRGSEFKGAKKRTTTKKATTKKPAYKKPKAGETAKQYKARLKRSGTISTQRALSGQFGTRKEYYSVPGTRVGGKKTRKSINRAKNRDFYSEGSNKRSKAITKSKQRQKAKVKKQTAWEKKNKTKAGTKKKVVRTKVPTTFSGTKKYSRQGKLSKASKGSGAKQKYKKATSELRGSKRGSSPYQQSQMGHPSKRKQGQVTRLTNKFTNRGKAATGETNLSRGLKRADRVKALRTTTRGKNPSVRRSELNYLKQSKALGKKLKNVKVKDPNRYVSPKELKRMKNKQLGTTGNKIVGFKRKKR